MLWIILALSLILLGFYYYFIFPHNYWKRRGIKQGRQDLFFGDLTKFVFRRHSFHDLMKYVYDKFPNERYCGMYENLTPSLVLRDPNLINDILVKHFDHFVDRADLFPVKYEPLWSTNLLNLKGDTWRQMRTTLSPAFSNSNIKAMFNLMTKCADQFTSHFLENKGVINVDLKDCFTRVTNDIIASCAFGVECNSLIDRDNEFYLMGRKLTDPSGFYNQLRFMLYVAFPSIPILFGMPFFNNVSTDFFTNLLISTMKIRKENNVQRPDLINLLMQAKEGKLKHEKSKGEDDDEVEFAPQSDKSKKTIKEITDTDIVAQSLLFFFGGFESVANVLIFTSYELALNPDIQERLIEEILNTQSYQEEKLSYTELNQMKFLDCVVKETLRKYPAFGGMDRVCLKTFTIEPINDNEKPVSVNPGDKVIIPIYGIQHDHAYFEDPERYNPDRFSEDNKNNLNPYAFLVFGGGQRNCIGARFSILEIKVLLFYLVSKFQLAVSKNTPIPVVLSKAGFNITVRGKVYIDFIPRELNNNF